MVREAVVMREEMRIKNIGNTYRKLPSSCRSIPSQRTWCRWLPQTHAERDRGGGGVREERGVKRREGVREERRVREEKIG